MTDNEKLSKCKENWRLNIDEKVKKYSLTRCAKPAGSMNSMLLDITTTYIRDFEILHSDRYRGVYIEIQPFSGLPNNIYHREVHMFVAWILTILNLKRA